MSVIYSNDIESRPEHLTTAVLQEALEYALHDTTVVIRRIHFSMGSHVGENYLSLIYRIKIDYTRRRTCNGKDLDETTTVIVKSMPPSVSTEFMQDLEVFLKEKLIYINVLPRMEVFLEKPGKQFGARLHHSLKDPINTFIFEDLAQKGFTMASREVGLDEEHASLVLRRLGEFHGISKVLAEKDPEIIKFFRQGILTRTALERSNSMLLRFFAGNMNALNDSVREWKGFETIAEKLERYAADLKEKLSCCQQPIDGEFKVLNHGDLWVNNMLFKYDANRRPFDIVFVDFQMSVWGSPGFDINYFLYTSLQLDVLKHKRDALLNVYWESLVGTLQRLGLDEMAPSYEQIRSEVRRRENFGFVANFGIYPAISMDKAQSSDNSLDNFADEEFTKQKTKQMFASQQVYEMLHYTLPHFDGLGVFD